MQGCAVLLAVLLTVCEASVRKQWTLNWDLNSKNNWREKKMPCAGRVATLPRYPHNSLFIGSDITVGSLELPVEGEVILGDKAEVTFDQTSSGACTNVEWTHRGRDQWWDPEGWSYPGLEDSASSPVPHLHRVPCKRDSVVFPAPGDSLSSVHFTPPAVSVTMLSIGNRNFTSTSAFAAYIRTPEGSRRFHGASSSTDGAPLYLESPENCRDATGCMCGSEQAASVICRIMSAKCEAPLCDNPIDMTGFCCPVCGAEVTINNGGSLSLERLRTFLDSYLQASDMKDVRGYVTKMSDQLYHVYFTAANHNGNYKKASETFKAKFNEELNAAQSHEVLVSYAGDMQPLVSGKVAPHHVAVTLVTLTVCLVVGAAVYYLRKRRITTSLSFMFRRLEDNSRRVSVVSDIIGGRRPSNASNVLAYSRESGLRFLNPIFNQSTASLAGAGVSSVINEAAQEHQGEQLEGQHENPMYTAFQNMAPEEQRASQEAMEEREKILEAAGQFVASPMRNSKEKKMSGPSESNLESITEEKNTKDVKSSNAEVHNTEDAQDVDAPKDGSSSPILDEKPEFLQDHDPIDNDTVAEVPKPDINEGDHPKDEMSAAAPEEEIEQPSQSEDTAETNLGSDQVDIESSSHLEQHSSSSTSTSSDEENIDDVWKNLEGFTPLVDLKFKE